MSEKVARVREKTLIAPDVWILQADCVEPPALSFRAGQFISLRCDIPGSETRPGDARRSYSLSSHPDRKDGFELLVKLVEHGVGSELIRRLGPGAELHFTGPMGFFTPDLAHAGDAVFAATGSGIAAALPMIADILARPAEKGRVLLYWGLRREEDVYWRDRLEALAARSPRFSFHICLTQPSTSWEGVDGRINQHVLAELPHLQRPVFYLVGNGDMVRELKKLLEEHGIDRKRQIRLEIFYPAAEP